MYFEATNLLTGDFLVKVDRASMAASLEVRCPLLDHRFAEFATRIPTSWKWQNGKGKRILLEALGDRLPPELLTRRKWVLASRSISGFADRCANWCTTACWAGRSSIAALFRRILCATC